MKKIERMNDRRPNRQLRQEVEKSGVRWWEVAQTLGVSESTLYRILRTPLTDKQTAAIKDLIKQIKEVRSSE